MMPSESVPSESVPAGPVSQLREAAVPDALAGERIDRIVAVIADVARSDAAALVDDGRVRVNGVVLTQRSRRLVAGDEVSVAFVAAPERAPLAPDASVELRVIYEDDALVVVDKPAGLVVHPGAGNEGGTLVQGMLARYPEIAAMAAGAVGDDAYRPGIVHRIDKGTSGLLVVARTATAAASLSAQLAARTVERSYEALAVGHFDAVTGLVDAPIGRSAGDPSKMAVSASGREARTRYTVRRAYSRPDPLSFVICRLETGRTHQIRVHLAAIGHPVFGDSRYGGGRGAFAAALGRPFLHAATLGFVHPVTGAAMRFDSPLPPDLAALLADLDAREADRLA